MQKLVFPAGNMWLEYKPEFYGQSPDDNIPDSKGTCVGGMFLPFVPGEFMWGRGAHIVIFALLLIWSFLGVAIIADVAASAAALAAFFFLPSAAMYRLVVLPSVPVTDDACENGKDLAIERVEGDD